LFVRREIGFNLLFAWREVERRGVEIWMIRCADDDFLQLLLFQEVENLFSFAETVPL
jgi:hypothetical protein